MSTAVAPASTAPLPPLDRDNSPKTYPARAPQIQPSMSSIDRNSERRPEHRRTPSQNSVSPNDKTDRNSRSQHTPPDGKRSPKSARSAGGPKIIVKKESPVSSPSMSARHRPRKLDLSTNIPVPPGLSSKPSATPMTARDGLIMQDVGIACLSPGFQTQDPTLREQLQRSLSVRDHQRSIIEARMLKTAKGDGPDGIKPSEANIFGNGPPTSTKKRPPPGLSIVPPSAEQFANERVIQSAPLNQTFTGRHQPNPVTRHVQPSNLSQTSHIHHVPAIQTNNRLPPLSEFLNSDMGQNGRHAQYPNPSHMSSGHRPPLPSPGIPPHTAHPGHSSRPREFRSAEEAVHEMTGGREDLRPKLVHYGGHQPPTPPSPPNGPSSSYKQHHPYLNSADNHPGAAGRRRSRVEYESDQSPPLGTGREKAPLGPFGSGRESPQTQRRKKDEFMNILSRAWDLWHN